MDNGYDMFSLHPVLRLLSINITDKFLSGQVELFVAERRQHFFLCLQLIPPVLGQCTGLHLGFGGLSCQPCGQMGEISLRTFEP